MNSDHRAVEVLALVRDGRYEDVVEMFEPPLRALVSAEVLRTAWTTELDRLGAVSAIGRPTSAPAANGLTRLTVPVTCERGGLSVVMSIDGDDHIHGLRIASAAMPWTPPSYADERRFVERDITVDGLPGTLTLPTDADRAPAVVLLSGGGPFDRDETTGPNRPLKDIAWGLASRGVAVVRFDKITYVDGAAASRPGFTATDEYVPAAVAAIRLLRAEPIVDPSRIFVLGHSMGGKIAPRVAAAEPSVAGLVVMAGDTKPMTWNAVRVARHLAAASPGPAMDAAVATIERQAAVVDAPDLSADTPLDQLLFGFSASYWLDMRAYDPVATAAAVGKPMLILQGGRDFQVTAEHDLAGWRAGLGGRTDVTLRAYDAADHMFFFGEGQSSVADYERPQHVDGTVVADIADWLLATSRSDGGLRRGGRAT
ncbi:alpha/beta hydrolase [Fodinicola acaciae]|uniref:alpha/beta hydrolase n=1 Tax=Fodinicola acaciae TaxID=2681555 RepID=UPI0013D4FB3C|nr:alpha/beta fold hydrolase [Fodinicola acaciae]